MDHIDEAYRNKIATLLRAICAAKYAKEDNLPCKIDEDVFLGSVGVACNKDALKDLDVTHILIVARSLEPAYPNDFIYKKIEVLDSPDTNLEQHFDECFNFIDEAKRLGGGVLVHCFAGKSRRLREGQLTSWSKLFEEDPLFGLVWTMSIYCENCRERHNCCCIFDEEVSYESISSSGPC